MTKPIDPFHSLKVQSASISKEKSSVLLDRSIKIFFRPRGDSVSFVEATIFEIFTSCQASLAASFDLCKFSIRGSSVAHIFSGEHYADIDIHGFIDLSHYSKTAIIKRGHEIKWCVLDSIRKIINKKLALLSPGSESILSLEQILFEDQFAHLVVKELLPFNVHTLKLGSLPLEFTFFAFIHKDFQAQRFFDFNCGALELEIDSQNAISLHSPLPDMDAVIEEISRRELKCDLPSQLFRKSICRYLSKVSLSGYYDKDPALLQSFISNIKEHKALFLDDDGMIQEIMKEIIFYFKSKGLDPVIGLMNLYFYHHDGKLLGLLKEQAVGYIVHELKSSSCCHLKAIGNLIYHNKLAECAWYFLFFAKKIHYVSHRSKECLQVEIPIDKLFEDKCYENRAFYINLPLIDLWKLKEVAYPGLFLQLLMCENYFESYSEKAKASLNALLSHVLIKNRLGSVLAAALNRLKIDANQESSSIFLQQLVYYRESVDEPLPFFVVLQALKHAGIQTIITPKIALEVVRQVSFHLSSKEANDLEDAIKSPLITQSIGMILKDDFLHNLEEEERTVYLNFAKAYTQDCIEKIELGLNKELDDIKKIINISFYLYLKGFFPFDKALKGAKLCFKNALGSQGALYLKNIVLKETHITKDELEEHFKAVIDISLLDYQLFCFKNKVILKEKFGDFVFKLFLKKIVTDNQVESHLDAFIEFYTFFLNQEEKEAFNLKVFQNAAINNPCYQKIFDSFSQLGLVTLSEFKSIDLPTNEEITFLFMQDSYRETLLNDEAFARFFIDKSLSLELYYEHFFSIKLLLLDSCHNRQELVSLLSHIALKPAYFLEALQLFNSLSIDSFDADDQQSILGNMLYALDFALCNRHALVSIFQNEETLMSIASLHKKYLKVTLKNPCWKKLWQMLSMVQKQCNAIDWIDSNDLSSVVLNLNPHGLLQQFLSAFIYDYNFVCHYIYLVSFFDPLIQSQHNKVICDLLGNKSYAIFNGIPFDKDENIKAASYVLNLAFALVHSYADRPSNEEDIARVMYLLLFVAAFGDTCARSQLLEFIKKISPYNETPFFDALRSMGLLEEIFITLCDHALKENNLQEIKNISCVFEDIFIIEDSDGQTYSKTNFVQVLKVKRLLVDRCQEWHKFLKHMFNKQSFIDSIDANHPALSVLDYYFRFLTQVVVFISHAYRQSDRVAAESDQDIYLKEIQTLHLNAISTLLDLLTAKKFILSSQTTVHLLSLIGNLEQAQIEAFINKFLFYATQQIRSIQPGSKDTQIQQVGFFLLKYAAMFAAHLELKYEGFKDSRQIVALLEASRSRLSCFNKGEMLIDPDFLNTLSFVEGALKSQEVIAYFENWLKSIVSRPQSVTYDEINLFTIFTFRCDTRFSKSIANGQNYNRFEKKCFITPAFFQSPLLIKDLISLFDIAFSRFYPHVEKDSLNPMMMNLDIFSLFSVYSKDINCAIEVLKNRSEASKIQMQFIEVLSNVFEKPKSRLSFHVLQALWVYLITVDVSGIFSFKNKSKDQIVKSVQVFYRLIERLKTLPDSFIMEHKVPFEQLILTYDFHRPAFAKILTKSQNDSIKEFLTCKVTENFMENSLPGQALKNAQESGLLDDLLLSVIQNDHFGSSDDENLGGALLQNKDKENNGS